MNAVAHNLLNLRVQLADELRASTFITLYKQLINNVSNFL